MSCQPLSRKPAHQSFTRARYAAAVRLLIPALIFVTACDRAPDVPQDLDALDRELTDANSAGNLRDPAIAAALNAPIMIDPSLGQSSNANAVRPAPGSDSSATPPEIELRDPVDATSLKAAPAPARDCPKCRTRAAALTLGALVERHPAARGCASVSYSAAWANRLSAELPLYPDARVIEAAGNASGACRLRVVSFASGAAADKVINWYHTRATAAGYSAEHQAADGLHVLGGTRRSDAYAVYVASRSGGGSTIDLVSNAGR